MPEANQRRLGRRQQTPPTRGVVGVRVSRGFMHMWRHALCRQTSARGLHVAMFEMPRRHRAKHRIKKCPKPLPSNDLRTPAGTVQAVSSNRSQRKLVSIREHRFKPPSNVVSWLHVSRRSPASHPDYSPWLPVHVGRPLRGHHDRGDGRCLWSVVTCSRVHVLAGHSDHHHLGMVADSTLLAPTPRLANRLDHRLTVLVHSPRRITLRGRRIQLDMDVPENPV